MDLEKNRSLFPAMFVASLLAPGFQRLGEMFKRHGDNLMAVIPEIVCHFLHDLLLALCARNTKHAPCREIIRNGLVGAF